MFVGNEIDLFGILCVIIESGIMLKIIVGVVLVNWEVGYEFSRVWVF